MGIDGRGVTTLVAGAGCPLRCRWCINQKLLAEAKPEWVSAAELLERVKIDDLYFRATGGGVTFGGGESLLHVSFLRRFRELCPADWRLCAETSLAVPAESVHLAAATVDDFLVDCKDMDGAIYRRYTGGDGALMRSNLRLLLELAGPERVTVRVPKIPEYNSPEDQARSVELLRAMGVTQIDVFDYIIKAAPHDPAAENV
jgi:pyruvate formate lyase activating enzyme